MDIKYVILGGGWCSHEVNGSFRLVLVIALEGAREIFPALLELKWVMDISSIFWMMCGVEIRS